MPSVSPTRIGRVVAEMETASPSGSRDRTRATTLPFPTPEGPARTISVPRRTRASLLLAELRQELLALLAAQPTHAPRCGDVELLHDLLRAYLAHAGQRLEHRRDLHLAEGVVLIGLLEHIGERALAGLELPLDLCALLARGCRLLQCVGTLLRGKRRKRHERSPSVSRDGARTPGSIRTGSEAGQTLRLPGPARL